MTADVTLLADESKSSIAAVCRALDVPRSSVYARRSRPISARARDTAELDVDIAVVHAQSERRYGSPSARQTAAIDDLDSSAKRVTSAVMTSPPWRKKRWPVSGSRVLAAASGLRDEAQRARRVPLSSAHQNRRHRRPRSPA